MIHVGESGRIHGSGASLVDFNRAGTPLVEIVTEPDLRSAHQVREWAQLLRTTIRQLGVSDVNMEEGSLRVDANVSIRPGGLRGARHQDRAQEHEQLPLPRARDRGGARAPAELLESGEEVVQDTLHFHPEDGSLTPLRSKEYAHDYRYFPEPDLVPVVADRGDAEGGARVAARAAGAPARALPERGRPLRGGGDHARLPRRVRRVLRAGRRRRRTARPPSRSPTGSPASWSRRCGRPARRTTRSRRRPRPRPSPLWPAWSRRRRSRTAPASRSWRSWSTEGGDPAEIVEREGLAQISDTSELEGIVDRAIEAEPEAAEQVRQGNEKAIGRIVGAVMKETQGPRRRRRRHQADQGAALGGRWPARPT